MPWAPPWPFMPTAGRQQTIVGDATGALLRAEIDGNPADAESLGVTLAERLIEQGAGAMLETAG